MSDCPYGICPIRFVAKNQFAQVKIRKLDEDSRIWIADILETMTEEQKLALYGLVGLAFDYAEMHGNVVPKSENDIRILQYGFF